LHVGVKSSKLVRQAIWHVGMKVRRAGAIKIHSAAWRKGQGPRCEGKGRERVGRSDPKAAYQGSFPLSGWRMILSWVSIVVPLQAVPGIPLPMMKAGWKWWLGPAQFCHLRKRKEELLAPRDAGESLAHYYPCCGLRFTRWQPPAYKTLRTC